MDQEERDQWGEGVKKLLTGAMKAKGFTQRGLSSKLGLSNSAISVLLSRGGLGQWWSLVRICKELGLTPDELLGFKAVASVDLHAPGPRAVGKALGYLRRADELQRKARAEIAGKKKRS